jgi:hypothetical protein
MKRNRPKQHWGAGLWAFIHTISVIDHQENVETNKAMIEKLRAILFVLPCPKCKGLYLQYLTKLDLIDIRAPIALFYWSVDLHNAVNAKLGKPLWSYDMAKNTWCSIVMN